MIDELDLLLARLRATIVAFDDHQADIARDAFARYGKGRHRAGLNFGDCAAYALSRAEAEPLLFKGTDFGATDVEIVNLA
jgi:ribonuclease VapC